MILRLIKYELWCSKKSTMRTIITFIVIQVFVAIASIVFTNYVTHRYIPGFYHLKPTSFLIMLRNFDFPVILSMLLILWGFLEGVSVFKQNLKNEKSKFDSTIPATPTQKLISKLTVAVSVETLYIFIAAITLLTELNILKVLKIDALTNVQEIFVSIKDSIYSAKSGSLTIIVIFGLIFVVVLYNLFSMMFISSLFAEVFFRGRGAAMISNIVVFILLLLISIYFVGVSKTNLDFLISETIYTLCCITIGILIYKYRYEAVY